MRRFSSYPLRLIKHTATTKPTTAHINSKHGVVGVGVGIGVDTGTGATLGDGITVGTGVGADVGTGVGVTTGVVLNGVTSTFSSGVVTGVGVGITPMLRLFTALSSSRPHACPDTVFTWNVYSPTFQPLIFKPPVAP